MTRTECAAWVQAWGSVAAIAAAVWIAHRSARTSQQLAKGQAKEMRDAYVRARVERHLEQIGPVLELFDAATTELDYQFVQVANAHRTDLLEPVSPRMDELHWILKALEAVPVHSMPTAAAAGCLLTGRVLVKDAAELMEGLIAGTVLSTPVSDVDHRRFREAVRRIEAERERLREALTRLCADSIDSLSAKATQPHVN